MTLNAEQALRAYARMINRRDVSALAPLLADEFHYASQWVFSEIESRADYLAYIGPKLETIRTSGVGTWAEMGWLDRQPPVPCVILAQGDRDALEALVLVKLAAGKISRLDLCAVPSPRSARRTGEYPGCDGPGG